MRQLDLHSYRIQFGGVQSALSQLLKETNFSSLFVLVDENTIVDCLPIIKNTLPQNTHIIQIQSGELNKTLDTCQIIWEALLSGGADRQSLLINLGGGVIGDMGGFCASTFMRGIRFVQIPTTLLSQVDSSVGSKLGIDFQQVKNIIGLFQDPIAVLIDHTFLKTLSTEQLRSGFAEVIKHALIRDQVLWTKLQSIHQVTDVENWEDIIYRSVQIKQDIVQQDRHEKSLRKILNFGHTIGHAIESYFLSTDTPLLHGEAIGWGMHAECVLSQQKLGLSDQETKLIQQYLEKIYADKKPSHWDSDAIIKYMRNDKKNVNQKISFSLLDNLGNCIPDQFIDEENLIELFASF